MNWRALKQFDQLFIEGVTSSEILEIPLGRRILEMGYITFSVKKIVSKTDFYDAFYQETIWPKSGKFKSLIDKYNFVDTNFEEFELSALLKIENDKEQILKVGYSQKEISTLYFDNAKYLTRGSILFKSILLILEIQELAVDEHDQQFLKVLHCKNRAPKAILLCENENQLRKPRLNDIELWFAGGRNTAKLKFISEPIIPFYYLCDWDNRGIEIYQDIKKNIFPLIEILIPQAPVKFIDIKTAWRTQIDYSLFSEEAQYLLKRLIPEKWIEEESIHHSLLER